jgi:hypothetical protein
MNSTNINELTPTHTLYLTIGGWVLFVLSEVLPFMRKANDSNGLLHACVCLIKGSKCMAENILNVIDQKEIEKEIEMKVVQ